MRKTLFAAVALAPLWLLASQTSAFAQTATTISSATSTPVTTAADGDINIASGGSIVPTTANTAAVTINSNNSVSNVGTIAYKDVNNVVGIAVQGGYGSTAAPLTVSNAGAISLTESYAASDGNKDGVNEAPYASPTSSGRFGIQLTGTAPFVGSIINSGAITVQGSNGSPFSPGLPSYGVSLEAPLQGSLVNSGTISYTGDNGGGLRETGGVSGDVQLTGAVTATGAGGIAPTNAVVLSGNVGGRVSIYSAITSTGYGLTTRTTSPAALNTIQSTPNEVQQSGSAMVISGSVGAGVFLGAPPASTNTTDVTTDADGDGVVDSGEATGTITTFGSAPALVIGGVNNITIGKFNANPTPVSSSTGSGDFGVVIEGTVSGSGVYDGVNSTALQIGGFGGTTTVAGGLQVTGTIAAQSYGAVATAIHIGAGGAVPTIDNSGTISATVLPPNVSTTTSTLSAFNGTATAIQIDAAPTGSALAGGLVNTLVNSGFISATVTGDSNDSINAAAVVDRGGGLSTVMNTGSIAATLTPDATGSTVTGKPFTLASGAVAPSGTVALDLSANTSGVTLTQQQAPSIVVTTTTTNGVAATTVTTAPPPSGTLIQSSAAISTSVTNGNTTVTTTTPASPEIVGDIYLGNGSNTVNILAGAVSGALSLGAGPTAALTIDNGAIYSGALTYTGTSGAGLALNVNNGTLDNSAAPAAPYKTSSFNIGAKGVLFFGVDPANNRASEFVVSGPATIAAGAQLGLTFISNATGPETYTILSASSLTVGETNAALAGPVPYIFNAAITANPAAGTLTLAVSPKTPAQLGLNPSQSAALPATYQALALDPAVQSEFLNQYTRSGFLGVYNQVLPDYAGGIFQTANAASLAISRATAESNDIENPSGSRGAWAQELFIGVNQGLGQTDGFRGGGFGFVGGVETGGSGLGAFGTTVAFVSTQISDQHLPGDSQSSMSELELGGYWQGEFNGFVADARVGAGYTWMADRREFVQTNPLGEISLDRRIKSNWNGYTLSGHAGLAYKWNLKGNFLGGGWFIQPQGHIDYFRLNENAYHDNEAEGGPALSMAFDSRTGQETSGTASIVIGRKLGVGLVWRPEVELGVRDVFSGGAGDTTAHYLPPPGVAAGPSFTLTPADISGAAGIARIKLKASSEYYELGLEAGGEVLPSRYQEGDVKASVRVLF